MPQRNAYQRKVNSVSAVQLKLDLIEFRFRKWGAEQRCKKNDWLVDNEGDVYPVDKDYFDKYYRQIGPGEYTKVGTVWAEQAAHTGFTPTLEGQSEFRVGDYIVYDQPEGGDAHVVEKSKFEVMYALVADDKN
ncbi:hypothetical protein SAMN02745866_01004 [Alteromonadaceae bacterium Bs31]|nr:hypothetical protein SAMN02745866_01004 [Alteromonadaceae bacterium Bs31]